MAFKLKFDLLSGAQYVTVKRLQALEEAFGYVSKPSQELHALCESGLLCVANEDGTLNAHLTAEVTRNITKLYEAQHFITVGLMTYADTTSQS